MTTNAFKINRAAQPQLWFDHTKDPADHARLHALLDVRQHHFSAGSPIEHEADLSDAIYVIMEGWTVLSKSMPEGQTQIIDFGLPGDFYDLTSADGKTAAIAMQAVTDTTVSVVPVSEWIKLSAEAPQIGRITSIMSAAIRSRIAERMLRLGRGTAEERLAYSMLELGVRTGALIEGAPACFHIPITQRQLGDFMGLTSVHVCRTLRRMTRQNIITMEDHIDLCALNIEALEEMAGISADTLGHEILPHI